MSHFPETRQSLIASVRDPSNGDAWALFESLYRPVIFRIARSKGMQHADAQDVVQQVLERIASAIGAYEQRDGVPFRHWLNRIIRNAVLNALSRPPKDLAAGGTTAMHRMANRASDQNGLEDVLDHECRREMYLQAARIVRQDIQESTWLAFEFTVVDGVPMEQAAETLGVSVGTIYASRSRVMKRLRQRVQKLESEFEQSEGGT